MPGGGNVWSRWGSCVLVPAAGIGLWAWPAWGPLAVLPALLLTLGPLARAWRGAQGTALRSSLVWVMVAVGLGLTAELLAVFEPIAGGRPAAGHATYLCTLASLAGLISVLNARKPGAGVWAILMA